MFKKLHSLLPHTAGKHPNFFFFCHYKLIVIFRSRWELKSLKYVYDLTDSGESLIGKHSWEWQRDYKTLGRMQPQVCFMTIYFRVLQIFIFSSAGQPGWTRFCTFLIIYVNSIWRKEKKKRPANTQKLCHPTYHSGFCLWEVACFLNLFLIFLKRKRWLYHIANRPKQNCAADTCPFFVQRATAFLHYYIVYIASAGWNFGEQNESTRALEMTAMFSITCWIKKRLLCFGVLW